MKGEFTDDGDEFTDEQIGAVRKEIQTAERDGFYIDFAAYLILQARADSDAALARVRVAEGHRDLAEEELAQTLAALVASDTRVAQLEAENAELRGLRIAGLQRENDDLRGRK